MVAELAKSKPTQVLCVEDYAADRALIQKFFRSQNAECKITFVTNGADALDYLFQRGQYSESPSPNLILMDLNLPKIDGREVLKEIKASPALRSIPVVILTTSTNRMDIASVYSLHANCYLIKPQDLDDFQALMERTAEFWLRAVEFS